MGGGHSGTSGPPHTSRPSGSKHTRGSITWAAVLVLRECAEGKGRRGGGRGCSCLCSGHHASDDPRRGNRGVSRGEKVEGKRVERLNNAEQGRKLIDTDCQIKEKR